MKALRTMRWRWFLAHLDARQVTTPDEVRQALADGVVFVALPGGTAEGGE